MQDFLQSIPGNSIVLCNGSEKATLLKRLFPHVYHVYDLQLALPRGNDVCSFPASHSLCSYANVQNLFNYFTTENSEYETID